MKKIHVLPTDKPSRLHYFTANKAGYYLYPNNGLIIPRNPNCINQNIYITNDEEIKEGDFYLHISNDINGIEYTTINTCHKPHRKQDNEWYVDGMYSNQCKKIILTTDPDLIGVQAIDDEFLEWFVKNPSCEEIEIEDWYSIYLSCCQSKEQCSCNKKRIIIPKEEPKQVLGIDFEMSIDDRGMCIEIPINKQERLEEAFEFWSDRQSSYDELDILRFGAKWQQARSYSEEEVLAILVKAIREVKTKRLTFFDGGSEYPIYSNLSKWFEQFKKK